jgi:D-amino-acid dehydrogenase
LLLEKGAIGAGCSFANAGWLTPCFAMPLPQPGMFWKSIGWVLDPQSPLYIKPQLNPTLLEWMFEFLLSMNRPKMLRSIEVLTKLSTYSLNFYQELAQRQALKTKDIGFEKRGLLMVSATNDGLRHAELEMNLMSERGIAGRKLSKDDALGFEPSLRPLIKGGVYFPDEAQIEPFPATIAMIDEFKEHGGLVQAQTEVYDFEIQNGRIQTLHTTQGLMTAETIVLATGAWSKEVGRKLGIRIPVLGGKGYSMNIDMPENKPHHPIMIVEKKIAVTPRSNSVRLAGTLELVDQDFSISPRRVRNIFNGAAEYLKFDHITTQNGPRDIWRGLRPCTPDGVPVIGRSEDLSNLFFCLGHQLLGLQSAPGSGRLAADLLLGRPPLTDPHPFRPSRF